MEEISYQITDKDLFYLEDMDVAIKIKQLQATHSGNAGPNASAPSNNKNHQAPKTAATLIAEQEQQIKAEKILLKRKPDELFQTELRRRLEEIERGNLLSILYLRCLNDRNQEISGFIDIYQRIGSFKAYLGMSRDGNKKKDNEHIFKPAPLSTIYPQRTDLSFMCFNTNQISGNDSSNFQVVFDPHSHELNFKFKRDHKIIPINSPNRHTVPSENFIQVTRISSCLSFPPHENKDKLLRFARMTQDLAQKTLFDTISQKFLLKTPGLSLGIVAAYQMLSPAAKETSVKQAHPILGMPGIAGMQSVVLKYFARVQSAENKTVALYPEIDPQLSHQIDTWIASVDKAIKNSSETASLIEMVENALKNRADQSTISLLSPGSSSITVADLAVWSCLKSGTDQTLKFSENAQKWMGNVGEMPACKGALELVGAVATSHTTEAKSSDVLSIDQNDRNPMSIFKRKIAVQLAKHCSVPVAELETFLEVPKGAALQEVADYSLAVPRLRIKGSPEKIAADLAGKWQKDEYIETISASGIFLSFKFNRNALRNVVIPIVWRELSRYGTNYNGKGKSVVVEFSSPNIAKPFHAGHLRSTIIGNFIRNVCDANGYHTVAINYLGDWGKQYGLLAVGYAKYGNEEELVKDPIKHLFDVYVKISADQKADPEIDKQAFAYFKKMEDGDKEALALWSRFRELSIVKYEKIYERLNIKFDVYSGESMFSAGMKTALEHLKSKGILVEDDGSKQESKKGELYVDLEPYKLSIARVQRADGSSLYLTRDIAAAMDRAERYKFDRMFYVAGAAQDLHFKQLFKVLELAEFPWAKNLTHINFGQVLGMSTRRGDVVFLEDILDEAQDVMHSVMKNNEHKYAQLKNPMHTADLVGISAVMVQDMTARQIRDYEFDWKRMTSFEGDTGPYLQYAHARLCSIEKKFLESLGVQVGEDFSSTRPPVDFKPELLSHLHQPKINDLLVIIGNYPDLVESLEKRGFESSILITYLMQLCHRVSGCLEEVYVMGQERDVAIARFMVYWCARITLGSGLRILGLRPLEQM